MEIIRSDADHLVIADCVGTGRRRTLATVIIGTLILGSAIWNSAYQDPRFIIFAILFLAAYAMDMSFYSESLFDFDHCERRVTWRRSGLLGWKKGAINFDDISCARIDFSQTKSRVKFRPILEVSVKRVPLRHYFSSDLTSCETVRDEINEALGRPETTNDEDFDIELRRLLSRDRTYIALMLAWKFLNNRVEAKARIEKIKADL